MKKNKSFIRKFAEKISSRGSIDKTIAEWEKLLTYNQDGNTYNIVGDLYLKQKDTDRAVDAFKKAADAFRAKGFTLEAIAMNKKISNILPSELGAIVAVAELNAEKGLMGNAVEHYLEAAEAYSAQGDTESSREIYRKAMDLAPNNVGLKVRIAEIYDKSHLSDEAAKLYEDAASMYLNVGEYHRAKKVFLMGLSANADSSRALTGLSVIEERLDNIGQAYKYARDAMLSEPDNHGAIARCAELSYRAGQSDDAANIISEFVEADPSNVQLRKIISKIYVAAGMVDKAWSEVVLVIDDYLDREEWNDAKDLLNQFKDTDLVDARKRLERLYKSGAETGAAVSGHENMVSGQASEKVTVQAANTSIEDGVSQGTAPASEIREGVYQNISIDLHAKRNEASFYEQNGFINEAISAYEELLFLMPGDQGIEKRLMSLKLRPVPTIDPDEELSTHPGVSHEEVSRTIENVQEGREQETEKDFQTHYDLGIAYMEMDLMGEAIKEFRLASGDPLMKASCHRKIAGLYMESEDYENAAEELEKLVHELPEGGGEHSDVKNELREIYAKNKNYINATTQLREDNSEGPDTCGTDAY